jgi:hypothetical protein
MRPIRGYRPQYVSEAESKLNTEIRGLKRALKSLKVLHSILHKDIKELKHLTDFLSLIRSGNLNKGKVIKVLKHILEKEEIAIRYEEDAAHGFLELGRALHDAIYCFREYDLGSCSRDLSEVLKTVESIAGQLIRFAKIMLREEKTFTHVLEEYKETQTLFGKMYGFGSLNYLEKTLEELKTQYQDLRKDEVLVKRISKKIRVIEAEIERKEESIIRVRTNEREREKNLRWQNELSRRSRVAKERRRSEPIYH